MTTTGHEGLPVGRARRRVGRFVVVILVFTVGVQLGDAALHAVQDVGDFAITMRAANDRDPMPCLITGGLSLDEIAKRLLRFFRLESEETHISRN